MTRNLRENIQTLGSVVLGMLNPIPIIGERQIYRQLDQFRPKNYPYPNTEAFVDYFSAFSMRVPTYYVLYASILNRYL